MFDLLGYTLKVCLAKYELDQEKLIAVAYSQRT